MNRIHETIINTSARVFTKSTRELNRIPKRILYKSSEYFQSRASIKLPPELSSATDVHVSDKYKYLADKYSDTIKSCFDNDRNCEMTNNGVRKALVDRSLIRPDIDRIAEQYGAELWELTIFRLQETERASDRGGVVPTDGGWISELWHSDNDRPGQFKIIVYLSEVTEERAPFEYKVPAEYIPYKWRRIENTSRIPFQGEGRKVTGPKGTTLIFKNNIVHKGNYCRDGYRDVIMIGLHLPGPYTHIGDILTPPNRYV